MPLTYFMDETIISVLDPTTLEMTLDVFAEFATSEEKELKGVWKEIGPGAEILVGRLGNRNYSRMLGLEVEKHQRTLDLKNDVADKASDQIMIDVMAHTILLGWRGAEFKFKGVALPYSLENAKMVLAVKDFRNLVSKLASDMEAYRAAQEAAVVKS